MIQKTQIIWITLSLDGFFSFVTFPCRMHIFTNFKSTNEKRMIKTFGCNILSQHNSMLLTAQCMLCTKLFKSQTRNYCFEQTTVHTTSSRHDDNVLIPICLKMSFVLCVYTTWLHGCLETWKTWTSLGKKKLAREGRNLSKPGK